MPQNTLQQEPNRIFNAAHVDANADTGSPEPAQFPRASWRLIIEKSGRSGPANMALDQSIAEAAAAGDVLPTLRFYRWAPPAVSLGRHQALSDVDMEAVLARGYEIVRRPTGGRAILHIDELTYSVAAQRAEPRVVGGVMDAYLRLSNALVLGLQHVGLKSAAKAPGDARAGSDVSAACFETPSAYEITAAGHKLMGSAQSRRAGYVLQHGSLPLYGDITRLIDVLSLPSVEASALRAELAARACTLAHALGLSADDPRVSFDKVARLLADAFSTTLNIDFSEQEATPGELRRAAELVRAQFASPGWTESR